MPTADIVDENAMFSLFRATENSRRARKMGKFIANNPKIESFSLDTLARKLCAKAKEDDWRVASKSLYIIHRLVNSCDDVDTTASYQSGSSIDFVSGSRHEKPDQRLLFSRHFNNHLDGIIYVIRMRIDCLEKVRSVKHSEHDASSSETSEINHWRWALSYAQYLSALCQLSMISQEYAPRGIDTNASNVQKFSYVRDLMILKGPLRVLQFYQGLFSMSFQFTEATIHLLLAPDAIDAPDNLAERFQAIQREWTRSSSSDFELLISIYSNELIDRDISRYMLQLQSLQPPMTPCLSSGRGRKKKFFDEIDEIFDRRKQKALLGVEGISATDFSINNNESASSLNTAEADSSHIQPLLSSGQRRRSAGLQLQVHMEQSALNELQDLSNSILRWFQNRMSTINLLWAAINSDKESDLNISLTGDGGMARSKNGVCSRSTVNQICAHGTEFYVTVPEWIYALTRMKSHIDGLP
jgi:hypothetical protein